MTTPTPDRSAELMLLGQIHGIVQGLRDGQKEQNDRLAKIDERIDGMDGRLRAVEQKAAVTGAISGGAMGVGVALIVEGLRHYLRGNTPAP